MSPPASLIERLSKERQQFRVPAQLRANAHKLLNLTLGALFPHFSDTSQGEPAQISEELIEVQETLEHLLRGISRMFNQDNIAAVDAFIGRLENIHQRLCIDAQAIFEKDPAAQSIDEVIFTYPGFFAIAVHRLAHALVQSKVPLLPRLLSEIAHEKTGIDIHPGATIGNRFCIDHGTGLVIGETSVIGNDVTLYQSVTLGALSVSKQHNTQKRHPTLEDNVVVYAGATILGGSTIVGRDSTVAGNAWLTQSVPANSLVVRNNEIRSKTALEIDFVI